MNGVTNEEVRRVDPISMRFDVFIKKVIRGRIRNAIRDYKRQMDKFPLWHKDMSDYVPAEPDDDRTEQYRFNVQDNDVYFRDEQLVEAISGMARHFREVLLLSVVLGYTPDEIGEMMNLSRETVLKYRQLALKHLRNVLRRWSDERLRK